MNRAVRRPAFDALGDSSQQSRKLGGLILKGIADPVPACTVRVDAATAGRPFPVALAATAAERLVGRGAELDVLRDAFKAARGKRFSLRAFHDAILPYGGLPVSLIRWGLDLGE